MPERRSERIDATGPEWGIDFATSELEKARRDVRKMRCIECFLWLPAELFGDTDDTCAECRGEK